MMMEKPQSTMRSAKHDFAPQDRPATVVDPAPKSPPPRKRRWRWVVGLGLLTLVVVIALMPQIIAQSNIRQQIASSLMQDFDGTLEIGGADLAWWRPAELSEMSMVDQKGDKLATIASARISTPLWRMLWPGSEPLKLTISRPVVVYEIDAYGRTNWQRVFKTLSPEKPRRWPEFTHRGQKINIVVNDGRLVVKDHVSQRTIETSTVEMQFQKSAQMIEGALTGQTRLLSGSAAEIPAGVVQANFQLAMAGNQVIAGDVSGELKKTPLDLIQPWLKQAVPHLHLEAGSTDGTFESKWTGDWRTGMKLAVEGSLTASQIKARSTEWALGHELTGSQLTAEFKVDNTIPTAPGAFDIQLELNGANITPLSVRERLDQLLQLNPDHQADEALPETAPTLADQAAELPEIPIPLGQVRLQTQGVLNSVKQSLEFKNCQLTSDVFQLELAGKIEQFGAERPRYDLTGKTSGNIMPFVLLANPGSRDYFVADRVTPEEFAVKGRVPAARKPAATGDNDEDREPAPAPGSPAAPAETPAASEPFSAVAKWNWENLEAYGVLSESGSMWTRFEDQQLKIVPIDLKIGEQGEFLAKAHIDFRNDQRMLTVAKGHVLKNVAFSDNMCRTWLRYVAPVFADATDLEGKFSLFVNTARIDLHTGLAEELEGILEIDHCRLGPGPMIVKATAPIRNIAALGNRPEGGVLQPGARWVELPKQDVLFRKQDERVHHSQLAFKTGPATVTSEGSVGDDQTLDLAITIPLSFLAQGDRPIGRILQQQPLVLFVQGTFDKPEVDASQLANFGKQFGINAVDGLLQGIFDRRRNR